MPENPYPDLYSDYSYVARKPCGCIVAAMVDAAPGNTKYKKDVGKEVGKWVAEGYTIDRVPHEQVRVEWSSKCDHDAETSAPAEPPRLPGFE